MSTEHEKSGKPDEVDRKALGEKLRQAREYVGFSQEEVAEFLGAPRSALSLIESGQRKVDVLELKKLSTLYGRPIEYFTGQQAEIPIGADIAHLARKASELTTTDREELLRFAEYLKSRKGKES